MAQITFVGTGYVGLVNGVALAEMGHSVICFDTDEKRIKTLKKGHMPIYEPDLKEVLFSNLTKGHISFTSNVKTAYHHSDIIFLCVGTPQDSDGNANLTAVFSALDAISTTLDHECLIVVKSTVPVGSCEKIERALSALIKPGFWFEVASNPEFLSQGSALHDALHPTRIILGTISSKAEAILKNIYTSFDAPIVSVSRESAEMIKYASNSFLALKISYINEVANLCEAVGANILEVSQGMKHDPRIGSSFLNAGIGFGGSCLPKDSLAFCTVAKQMGRPLHTLEAAIAVNSQQKRQLYIKAKKHFGTIKGLKIAVLGLAFKPQTDDLRDSPALMNLRWFIKDGADVAVYDPFARNAFLKTELAKEVTLCSSVQDVLKKAQAVFIFTEWDEFKKLSSADFLALDPVPVIFDGRNIYRKNEMEKSGICYFSIGQ